MEVVWDKTDVVHMDDAMAVPATGGFYKSVAHHFYEVWTALFGCHTLVPPPPPLPSPLQTFPPPASQPWSMLLMSLQQHSHYMTIVTASVCFVQVPGGSNPTG